MPVQKYRSVEEMPTDTWLSPGDPLLHQILGQLWKMSRFLAPRQFPAGVWKHRSIEDMNRQRDQWDAAYVVERLLKPVDD